MTTRARAHREAAGLCVVRGSETGKPAEPGAGAGARGLSASAVTWIARRSRCHDADVLHSVRARKSLPASLDAISPHANTITPVRLGETVQFAWWKLSAIVN